MYKNTPVKTVYQVWEQYPHAIIASFFDYEDARAFVQANSGRLALPLITSHFVMAGDRS